MAEVLIEQQRPVLGASERLDNFTRKLLLIVLAFVPVALALAFQIAGQFNSLDYPAAMDSAQIARNVLHGRGFTTDLWTPLALSTIKPDPLMPEITSPPIYPLALALGFGAFGESDAVVKGMSAAFFVLSALMVFLIAQRQFSLAVATLATALYGAQFQVVKFAFAGTNVMAASFFLLLFWYVLTRPGVGSPRSYLKAGLIFGLGYLTQYSFALFAPAAFVYILRTAPERRWRAAFAFVLGALLITSPWLVRNALLMHNPLYTLNQYDLLMNTSSYGGFEIHRSFGDVSGPIAFFVGHIGEVAAKALSGFLQVYWQLPSMIGLYVLPFFILALLFRVDDRSVQAQKNLLLAFFVLQIIGICLGDQMAAHTIKLAPLAIVFAAGYLIYVVNTRLDTAFRRVAAVVVLVLAIYAPTLVELAKTAAAGPSPALSSLAVLDRSLPRDAVVISDAPWAVAWYAHRKSVWLPLGPRELNNLENSAGHIKVAYITRYAASFTGASPAALAQALMGMNGGGKFRVVQVYKTGDVLLARE